MHPSWLFGVALSEATATSIAIATGRAVGAGLLVVALIASTSGDAAVVLAILGLSVYGG
jgi:hypothetical protein